MQNGFYSVKSTMTGVLLIFCLFAYGQLFAQTQLSNIPTLYVTTDDGINPWSKTEYQTGRVIVKSSDATEALDTIMKIRGRGNSTWGASKKPYRMKLDKKWSFLNNKAKAKDWVLLANDFDKTLIRNAVAFKISELIGFEFSPSVRFVDLVLNGSYVGNYLVTDQIEVHKNRVPVEEQEVGVTHVPDISGGYLLEVDGFASSEPWWFRTNKGLQVSIHYPDDEDINMNQYNYISNFTQKFETALFSSNFYNQETGYRAYVDEASLINWYIASELTGNPDAFWSTYLYKFYNDDKFFFGPLWDFDIAFNNDDRLGDATLKLMREHAHEPKTWIKQLWKDDWFRRAVYLRWMELTDQNILNHILTYIDETAALIKDSQVLNENKWHKVNGNYTSEINKLKNYMTARVNFLTQSFSTDVPLPPSEPFEAGDFYYMIMNVHTNNVIEVQDASLEALTPLHLMAPKEEDFDAQRWVFIDESITYGAYYYRIFNARSGMAIAGNGKSNHLIQTIPNEKDSAQMWQVVPVLTGNIYGLVNLKTDYSANNEGGNPAEGTPVIEYNNRIAESENQQWYLKRMEEITDLPGYPIVTDKSNAILNPNAGKPFAIYPNPVSDQLFIRINTATTQVLSVKIYSIDGQRLYDNHFNSNHPIVIPVSGMKSGLYILKVNTGKGSFIEKLQIKMPVP